VAVVAAVLMSRRRIRMSVALAVAGRDRTTTFRSDRAEDERAAPWAAKRQREGVKTRLGR
jgi:hypothetical protein